MHLKFTYAELLTYFGQIASKSKLIDDSIEIQNSDPTIELQKMGDKTVMLIEDPKAEVSQEVAARINQFMVIDIVQYRNTKATNPKLTKDIKDYCQKVAIHVISYLNNELREGTLAIDLSSVNLVPIDFYDINWHGFQMRVPIKTSVDISYKAEEWAN